MVQAGTKNNNFFLKETPFCFFVADASMLISRKKEGLSLKAPDYGIEELYYDGHRFEVF